MKIVSDLSQHNSSLKARVAAVEGLLRVTDSVIEVGSVGWDASLGDLRLLAANAAMRRQLESIKAAVLLARQALGHLAVTFVRAALEDVMYLKFFFGLDRDTSQQLFTELARWDGFRSVLCQRAYLGDEVMNGLGFPSVFLNSVGTGRDKTREELRRIQKEFRWAGGDLPTSKWIAEQAGLLPLYEYLHAATSRALHFSAGEITRRGWGSPSGTMRTDDPEAREYFANFALYQLVVLFFDTWAVLDDEESAGIRVAGSGRSEIDSAVQRIAALGQVPLVVPAEFNLRSDRTQ